MFDFKFKINKLPDVRLIYILMAVLFLLISYPFFVDTYLYFVPVILLDIVIPLLAIYLASGNKQNLFFASALAIPLAVLSWLSLVREDFLFLLLLYIFGVVFYIFAVYEVLSKVIRKDVITVDIIVGSIAAYLMLGLAWTSIYALIDLLVKDSFNFSTHLIEDTGTQIDYIYYSFVTLTNLGYGDITPTSHFTRSFSILESATGVIFTAVVVGRVIGLYVAERGHTVFTDLMD